MKKILFIGGTGVISSACTPAAMAAGFEVTLLNRGHTERQIPSGVEILQADYHDPEDVAEQLAGRYFDSVVNWIAFTPDQITRDIQQFSGRVGQYIFISSASAYQTPPETLPVTEETPLENPFWEYSRNKIACETELTHAGKVQEFPYTIVRPSHTYDRTLMPFRGGTTCLDRLLKGQEVIVHGDGSSLWVLTHHQDFAKGFTGLLCEDQAIGNIYHITSNELLTWDQIMWSLAGAAGVEPKIVHIPSEVIQRYDPDWGASLMGDKSHSMIFDNTKIKQLVPDFEAVIPFRQGAREIVSYYLEDEERLKARIDPELNRTIDQILNDYHQIW
jgi:nucleoside-diphosphate-sugar epimerase